MKSRILIIDAMRGVAAFWVTIFHLLSNFPQFVINPVIWRVFPEYGYSAVYLFFVISGFCIHLPWCKRKVAGEQSPLLNFKEFWKHRWRRIYPAYLAAFMISLVWQFSINNLEWKNGFLLWDIILHLLMLHNIDSRTVYTLNGVFWTLAVEEQLYLLYFGFLRMRLKLGWLKTLIIIISLRFFWFVVCNLTSEFCNFDLPFNEGTLPNWWIWVLGALAAENYYKLIKIPEFCYSIVISLICFVIAALIHFQGTSSNLYEIHKFMLLIENIFWGGGFFIIVNLAVRYQEKLQNVVIKFWAFVGLFSYSLYLTHQLIIVQLPNVHKLLIITTYTIFALIFYKLFEEPFILKKKIQT